jgi:PKD domain
MLPAFRYFSDPQLTDGRTRRGRMYSKRYRLIHAAFVPGVLALALIGAGCGGGDDNQSSGTLEIKADLDRYAGPVPLTGKFSANAKNNEGEVYYRWRFDDGTQSEKQAVTHSFPRPGYYTVILDARDESGNNARQSLLLGAWPVRQWAQAQNKPITRKGAIQTQKVQQARTDKRRKELIAELRKELSTSGS